MNAEKNKNAIIENNSSPSYMQLLADHPRIAELKAHVELVESLRSEDDRKGRVSPSLKLSSTEGFIGAGGEKSVYSVDEYAVKFLHKNKEYGFNHDFDSQVSSLEHGTGIAHLEQIVVSDKSDEVIVTEKMPGKPIFEISSIDLARQLTRDHIAQLKITLDEMKQNFLDYDNGNNVLFDPETGFNFIDYRYTLEASTDTIDEELRTQMTDHLDWKLNLETFLHDNLKIKYDGESIDQIEYNGEASKEHARRNIGRQALLKLVMIKARTLKK